MEAIIDGSLTAGMTLLLLAALLVALAFEFVNGFHDTANAVATVIYTNTLKSTAAVVLSGLCNFTGVFVGGIAVAMSIIRLLPVELLVSSGAGRGMAMVIALLLAAIIWNLGTWWLALPASSSHTMIGAILGIGLANGALEGELGSGVSWHAASHVGASLLLSPMIGFGLAAGLLWLAKRLIRDPALYEPPHGDAPPPGWIRALLIATCAGVSFTHGSNDGQKGVGLIMLILVGILPANFALNASASAAELDAARTAAIEMVARADTSACATTIEPEALTGDCAIAHWGGVIATTLDGRASVSEVPKQARWQIREAVLRIDGAWAALGEDGRAVPEDELAKLDVLTDYAPPWVILAIALALGIGTTVGYKRIVVTVGEKIGKSHLTYAQGACAELVAVITIGMSSLMGLPVSTTHVLSSGVAGTMVAQRSGLQTKTVTNIALAWVLTLPAAMLLSALLYTLLVQLV